MDAPTAIAAGLVVGAGLIAALPKDFAAVPPSQPKAKEATGTDGEENASAKQEEEQGEEVDTMTQEQAAAEQESLLRRRRQLEAAGVDVDKVQCVRLIQELETEGDDSQRRIEHLLIAAMTVLFVMGCLAVIGFLVTQYRADMAMYN
ncbi:Hypothetical Protein FCC1311_085832 [Hondaea fermentalgiana]|uniref:Uncharacterized protein n=1 Tax=Hondaea fermentalgiana TaxID=2315210 RepID=A0A2R5GRG9_9STRA|nr:Hypothetical Protein FCC1311_085832 [Hondaea fermentalgiana]|eukprot:GBG32358.1 Hypothetical Protein FCC1311_085832 [Hondaea fermentalgiana]